MVAPILEREFTPASSQRRQMAKFTRDDITDGARWLDVESLEIPFLPFHRVNLSPNVSRTITQTVGWVTENRAAPGGLIPWREGLRLNS